MDTYVAVLAEVFNSVPFYVWVGLGILALAALVAWNLLWRKSRKDQARALSIKLGGSFYPQGSSDAEMRFWVDDQGRAQSAIGVEREPLRWKDLEPFSLFQLKLPDLLRQGRELRNIIEVKKDGICLFCFEYSTSETWEVADPATAEWSIANYYVFRFETPFAGPPVSLGWSQWNSAQEGKAGLLWRLGLPATNDIEQKIQELLLKLKPRP